MLFCNVCKKEFNSEPGLKHHMTMNPNQECLLECPKCLKKFKSKKSVEYHTKNVKCVKVYKCDMCDKTFSRIYNYNKHIETHKLPPNTSKEVQLNESEAILYNALVSSIKQRLNYTGEIEVHFNLKNQT